MSDATRARRDRLRESGGGSLRGRVAGGVIVNAFFSIGLQGVGFLRGFIVAIFLAPRDYGVWAIISVAYLAIGQLKEVGIPDKYVQQDDDSQTAFQRAFTIEAILSVIAGVVLAGLTPVVGAVYNTPEVVVPGLVSLLTIPGSVLQAPLWIYRREMDFRRLRMFAAVDPVVGAVVTVAAAWAGLGYWAFVLGNVIGAWACALVALPTAPYRLRLRFDRATAREYVTFSTPVFVSAISNLFLIQGTMLFARSFIGVAGIGAMSITNSIRIYTALADGIISSTMFPAISAVKDRVELLHESFVKSNRLALMWGVPFGVGVALFARDLIVFVLGDQWLFAEYLFVAVGLTSAIGHIAFNWDQYVRATGNTRPLARYAWFSLGVWAVIPIPLMVVDHIRGYGTGMMITAVLTLAFRGRWMQRMFHGFSLMPHVVRAITPSVPATAFILVLRTFQEGPRTPLRAASELVMYLTATALVTRAAEGELLREAFSYLRRRRAPASA